VDTLRPSPRTNRTRRVPQRQCGLLDDSADICQHCDEDFAAGGAFAEATAGGGGIAPFGARGGAEQDGPASGHSYENEFEEDSELDGGGGAGAEGGAEGAAPEDVAEKLVEAQSKVLRPEAGPRRPTLHLPLRLPPSPPHTAVLRRYRRAHARRR
jgi:hypothetical protein